MIKNSGIFKFFSSPFSISLFTKVKNKSKKKLELYGKLYVLG